MKKLNMDDIKNGFRYLKKSLKPKLAIISHGTIIERALVATKNIERKHFNLIDVIDLIQSKPFPTKLKIKMLL